MANRRMLAKSITNSSAFLMMPLSAQALYMHLNQNADDDGYCEYFGVMRLCGAQPDDLSVLKARSFVKIFDDKVLLLKDWKENNYLQADRYTKSKYLDVYIMDTDRIQDVSTSDTGEVIGSESHVYKMDTQVRIGKDRIVEESNNTIPFVAEESATEDIEKMRALWKEHAGTTLRNHVPQNLKSYRYLVKELGENVPEFLKAVRMIRADRYQKRTLQAKLINYVGLRDCIEEVEAYMQSIPDRKVFQRAEQARTIIKIR